MDVILFALLAALFFGLAPVLEKRGLEEVEPLPGLFIRSAVVFSALLLAVVVSGKAGALHSVDRNTVLFLGAGGICGALIGHLFYYLALKAGKASEVVPVASIYPLVALMIAVVFLGEKVSVQKVVGVGLIVLGVVLIRLN
jgi:transporter family protein